MKKTGVLEMILAAFGAALISVCSWIALPFTVPFTLQTFAVFCVLLAFGYKVGLISIIVYILLGLIGLPVFSNFQSGAGVLFGATGGYILGFIFIGIIYAISQKFFPDKTVAQILSLFIGLIFCYFFGTFCFITFYTKNTGEIALSTGISICVLPFVIPDIIKLLLAVFVSQKIKKIIVR